MTTTANHPRTSKSFKFYLPLIVIVSLTASRTSWIRSLSHSLSDADRGASSSTKLKGTASAPRENFSSELSKDEKKKPNFIVLLTCSIGFFDMWENWLKFFEKLRIPNLPVHLFAEDNQTYVKCKQSVVQTNADVAINSLDYVVDLTCLPWDTVFSQQAVTNRIEAKGYRESGYVKMMSHRPAIIQYELEMGYDIIFSDVDVVWKKNPLPYFQEDFSSKNSSLNQQEVHVWAQSDGVKKGNDFLCPGFMVYRNCPETIALVDLWRRDISIDGKERRNQKSFNNLLWQAVKNGVEIASSPSPSLIVPKTLPTHLFATGNLYFKEMSDEERSKVVIVHNNGISGYDNKVNRMKDFHLWLVKNTTSATTSKAPKNRRRHSSLLRI